VPIEDNQEKAQKDQTVGLDLLDRIVIEEDVTVDLREAKNKIQDLQVSLILQILISVVLALRLSYMISLTSLRIFRDSNFRIGAF
jgi:hypothetical protein